MTLAELRLYSRRLADMENSQFISEPELLSYINDSYGALYDKLVAKYEDYYIAPAFSFTITTPGSTQALPGNFYKLRGLDKLISGTNYADVRQWMFADRNQIDSLSILTAITPHADVRYRILGQEIHFLPSDKAPGTYRLWYVPRITKLVGENDATANMLDFDEWIAIDVALKMLQKEETTNEMLVMRKAEYDRRIDAMAANRSTDPQKIQDVRRYRTGWEI
jgi:hypothetical protein